MHMHLSITKAHRMKQQELETPSSTESNTTPEAEPRRENSYGSQDGVEKMILASEAQRMKGFDERCAQNRVERELIGEEEKRSSLPIVDVSAFEEYNELVKQYSDLAYGSEYKAEVGEIVFLVEGYEDITAKVLERVCKLAQEKVQSEYKDLMFTIKRDGVTFVPNLVYFRLTPAKKVFLSFNIPQLRVIAYKKAVGQNLVVDNESFDFLEKFKQLCSDEKSKEADVVDAECKEVCSAIVSLLQSQSFGVFDIWFKQVADKNDFAILRIIQPYNQIEDCLDPLFWKMEGDGVEILAKTPIFNEEIFCEGKEFHSALVLISIPFGSKQNVTLPSTLFPQTKIDVLAYSFKCRVCVRRLNSAPCPRCRYCEEEGSNRVLKKQTSCKHGMLYGLK